MKPTRSAGPAPRAKRYRMAYRRSTLINPIIIFVSDFQRCLRFYRRVFNLKLLRKLGEWAELDAEGFVLSIHGGYEGEKSRHQKPLGLHFLSKDIKKTIKLVKKYGGTAGKIRAINFRPDELVTALEARFRDPDGNEFELRQVVSVG